MNSVPLHPALVHIPLGLAFVLPIVALGVAVALWRGFIPRKAWFVVVALQAAVVAGGVVALRAGEQDEHRVERVVGKTAVHDHEHAGKAFVWGAAVALALTLVAMIVPGSLTAAAAGTAAAAMIVVAALGYRAGKAGGELVYARGAASAYTGPTATAGASPPEAREHHRDHRRR